jgi:acyl carrier protein
MTTTKEDPVASHALETGEPDRNAIAAGMVRVLVKILKVRPEQIRLESSLTTDLRADSLDLAEIAAELEDEFHVKVAEEQVHMIATVGEAIDYVRRLQQAP